MCRILGTWQSVQCASAFADSGPEKSRPWPNAARCLESGFSSSFLAFVAVLTVAAVQGLPIAAPPNANSSTSAVSRAVEFLTKFGYLPASDHGTGNLRKEDQLRAAIRTMQRFGNLEPTGVIDEVTLQLMDRPRCGVPDVLEREKYRVKRYAVQGQKWSSTNLTWSVRSSESEADRKMVRSQLRRAFHVWSDASVLNFSEVRGSSGGPADIVVSFLKGPHGDGYPFDGEGSVLAHAFFPGEGIGGDAHFDAEERWMSVQPEDDDDGVNFFAVAAHEIGHSLGLSHSSTPGSLMFPYYQSMGENFKLPTDDADGIRYLYGSKEPKKEPTMPSLSPTSTPLPNITATSSVTTDTVTKTTKSIDTVPKASTTEMPSIRTTTEMPEIPDVCNTSIDAISVIRREVFVFKDKYFWRLDMNRTLRNGYPVPIDRFWYNLPHDIERIDALYERPTDTKIVFFAGKQYWLFSANQLEPGYPRPLTDLGLPANLDRIDAALVWGYNGRTYFFSGSEYWKFDETDGKVELDYPRDVTAWRGVPFDIDAAFRWNDGNTYFFKGNKFWKFLDVKMRIENKPPSKIGTYWFRCGEEKEENTELITTQRTVIESPVSSACKTTMVSWLPISVIVILLFFTQQNALIL